MALCAISFGGSVVLMTDDLASVFEAEYLQPDSAVEAEVLREVLGDEYPDGLAINSFVSRTELARIVEVVAAAGTQTLVDVGCGRGGPGMWVATATGSRLVGIDIAASAVAAASQAARKLGIDDRCVFREGSFGELPLDDGEADAVMSVDALLFAPDKEAAVLESHRVLRPGGVLVFTSWDYRSQPPGRPPQVSDHRPILEASGFTVEQYDETQGWREREDRTIAGLLAAVSDLAAESGDDEASIRKSIEAMEATTSHIIRRVLVVANRTR